MSRRKWRSGQIPCYVHVNKDPGLVRSVRYGQIRDPQPVSAITSLVKNPFLLFIRQAFSQVLQVQSPKTTSRVKANIDVKKVSRWIGSSLITEFEENRELSDLIAEIVGFWKSRRYFEIDRKMPVHFM